MCTRFILNCLLICACGADPGTGPVDAPQAPPDSQDPALCRVAADFGDLGTRTGNQNLGPTTSSVVVDAGPPRDNFFLKLVAGKGVFAAGLTNGTFAITGAELDINTCGLCVNLVADIGGAAPQQFYFANAGSVTLTSTSPPAGSISNVTMHETTTGGVKVAGGCVTSIRSMAFAAQ